MGALFSDSISTVSFWKPEKIMASAWFEHAPFAYWLMQAYRPKILVELGTHNGFSYFSFCQAVKRLELPTQCFAIDTWNGDDQAGFYGEDVFASVLSINDESYRGFSTLLRCRFDEALPYFADGEIDLLHIDGHHTYEDAKADFESWKPKLSIQSIVLFHDINVRERGFGVWKLWGELTSKYPHFSFVHGHGLGVLAYGNLVPEGVSNIFAAVDANQTAIRNVYAALGGEITRQYNLIQRVDDVSNQSQISVVDPAEVERLKCEAEELRRTLLLQKDTFQTEREAAARTLEQVAFLLDEVTVLKTKKNELNSRIESLEGEIRAKNMAENAKQQKIRELRTKSQELQREIMYMEEKWAAAESKNKECEARLELNNSTIAASLFQDSEANKKIREYQTQIAMLQVQINGLQNSFSWRAMAPIRLVSRALPAPIRKVVRRTAKAIKWTITGTLRRRLHDWREIKYALAEVSSSPLFDTSWYLEVYPDVAAAGINPAFHYVACGGKELRHPGPDFDVNHYVRQGDVGDLSPLIHWIRRGQFSGWKIVPVGTPLVNSVPGQEHESIAAYVPDIPAVWSETDPVTKATDNQVRAAEDLLRERFSALEPLRVFPGMTDGRRVTIITDSLSSHSLFGGVGTAIVIAALLAKRLNGSLRIITRSDPTDAWVVESILRANKVEWDGDIETLFSPPFSGRDVAVSKHDIFITTSWWTTACALKSIRLEQIVYLIQEDERMFYSHGDDRLQCQEILADERINVIVNTKLLFQHLSSGSDALPGLHRRGLWFEPAFPAYGNQREKNQVPRHERRFFFYARPQHPRNLYWRGLQAIISCIHDGILNVDEWEFFFVGNGQPELQLPGGVRPHILEKLSWQEYSELVGTMDVALCLMDTPHPSYPPIDLALSGAAVITNNHGIKTSLNMYSDRITTTGVGVDDIKEGIAQVIRMAELQDPTDDKGFVYRDWQIALEPVFQKMSYKELMA
jgi:hypothetical protein